MVAIPRARAPFCVRAPAEPRASSLRAFVVGRPQRDSKSRPTASIRHPSCAGATDESGVLEAAQRAAETPPNEEGATARGLHGATPAGRPCQDRTRPMQDAGVAPAQEGCRIEAVGLDFESLWGR